MISKQDKFICLCDEVNLILPRCCENNRLLIFGNHIFEKVQQNTVFALAGRLEEGQLERIWNLGLHVESDQGGVCQPGLGKVHQHLGQRSGEQDCLSGIREKRNHVQILFPIPGVGQSGKNLSELITETHLKQTISLVKHDIAVKIKDENFCGKVSC